MFKKLFGLFKNETPPPEIKQYTFIYCECGNELCSSNSFISDTYDENNDNHVLYKCSKCGLESDWNFEVIPGAINWKTLRNER